MPHEVIATQQGIAAVLHGFGCSRFSPGALWCEASWGVDTTALDPNEALRE